MGKKHLGGEKILALNRTSSGILASILALVKPDDDVVHYLPQFPSHPSIPRSTELIGANYHEFDDLNNFKVRDETGLVVITGSTMDHQVLKREDFLRIIEISKAKNVPVLVDDASGARLRTIVYKQPRAMDMGADLVITSTDKLMDGPRGGLMSGRRELVDLVKSKAHQFGLEAQPPLIAGMVRALENFNPELILKAKEQKKEVYQALVADLKEIKETPTGIMLLPDDIMKILHYSGVKTSLTPMEVANVLAMIFLRDHNIITIPAVGMPGASPTIRLDMASKDAQRLETDYIIQAFNNAFFKLQEVIGDEYECKKILFN
ncbi:MAG: selenocysteine synthase [Methanobacterium sp. PtaU1.Bin242]|nr:MAG: selenocysteine synthase [Methanobacterium sp. PtaU1.Bin242]